MSSKFLKPQGTDILLEKKETRLGNVKSAWYYKKTARDLDSLEGDLLRIKPSTLRDKT